MKKNELLTQQVMMLREEMDRNKTVGTVFSYNSNITSSTVSPIIKKDNCRFVPNGNLFGRPQTQIGLTKSQTNECLIKE